MPSLPKRSACRCGTVRMRLLNGRNQGTEVQCGWLRQSGFRQHSKVCIEYARVLPTQVCTEVLSRNHGVAHLSSALCPCWPPGRKLCSGTFVITTPINGAPATQGNGSTIGFAVQSPEQGNAFHAAGVANGGTTCEDPPGFREGPAGKIYLAYLRDPDGNKICALHRPAK